MGLRQLLAVMAGRVSRANLNIRRLGTLMVATRRLVTLLGTLLLVMLFRVSDLSKLCTIPGTHIQFLMQHDVGWRLAGQLRERPHSLKPGYYHTLRN